MSDEIDAVLNEVSPGLKDKPAAAEKPASPSAPAPAAEQAERPEDFDEAEYESEDDPEFDTDKVQIAERKSWPKKYVNALSRRDKELTELRAFKAAQAKQISKPAANNGAAPEAPTAPAYSPEQQAKLKAVQDKKPKLEAFKDYGEYIEALTDWKADVRDTQRDLNDENRSAASKNEAQQAAAIAENEARVVKQAKELIEKRPEYLALVQENADILSSFDQLPAVANAFGSVKHPELAFLALASTEGALQHLARMDAASALQYMAKAELIGQQMMAQGGEAEAEATQAPEIPAHKSKAPTPIRASKGVRSGSKGLEQMDADELDAALGFSKY